MGHDLAGGEAEVVLLQPRRKWVASLCGGYDEWH